MESNEPFSWKKRIRSFSYAFKGMATLFRQEHNSRIHLAAAALAIILGFLLDISPLEWVAIVGCIAAVLAAEAMNSAIEALCDRFGPQRHPLIGKAKDTAAAAVLFLAIGALIIGFIIFSVNLTRLISL